VKWRRVGGSHEFDQLESFDMDVGWGWTVERGGERRTISVIVAGGRRGSRELPEESRRAIETRGRTAIESVLDREDPPRYIIVSLSGLSERAE